MTHLDCPKLDRCPGCPHGAAPYATGLAKKGQLVAAALASFPELTPELGAARAAAPTSAYRLRAKLVVDAKALGLYERGSHRVVDVSGCRVLSASLTAASEALRRALPLPIHGVDLRETSEGVLVTLLSDGAEAQVELERAARALLEAGAALSVAVSVRPEGNPRLLAGEAQVVAGPAAARHRLSEDAPYAYAAHGGFVQAHAGQASYLQRELAAGLSRRCGGLAGLRVLELFAGNGSLALALSRSGARVTAVEAYAPAIALAERAAREQGLELRAHADDAGRFLSASPGDSYDAVIVNPPRRGLDPELRRALSRARPRAVAYVSCNPRTLTRDLWHLRHLGLGVESAEPLDMIPWSDAVEVLAWLRPTPAPAPRVLFEDEHWLAIDDRLSGVKLRPKTTEDLPGPHRALQAAERELVLLARGNLRKQGTVTRRDAGQVSRGARYKKQAAVGRHSLVSALTSDADEASTLRDFASIGHPVLGDGRHGDARSNQHLEHRHGLDRPFVHCVSVRVRDSAGVELLVKSELAPDLAQVLESLGSD